MDGLDSHKISCPHDADVESNGDHLDVVRNRFVHSRRMFLKQSTSSTETANVHVSGINRQDSLDSLVISCPHDADVEFNDDHLNLVKTDPFAADRCCRCDQKVERGSSEVGPRNFSCLLESCTLTFRDLNVTDCRQ